MNQTYAPGKTLLLVVGILLVIFSGLSMIAVIPTLILGFASLSLGGVGFIILLAAVLACASVIIDLIAGILGIVNREKPEKAKTCMALGVTMIVIAALNILSSIGAQDFNIFSAIFGLLLPILYTVGASKNKNAAAQNNSQY